MTDPHSYHRQVVDWVGHEMLLPAAEVLVATHVRHGLEWAEKDSSMGAAA